MSKEIKEWNKVVKKEDNSCDLLMVYQKCFNELKSLSKGNARKLWNGTIITILRKNP